MIAIVCSFIGLVVLYWYRSMIRNGVDLYFSYKYLIDPDDSRGHLYTMFKLSALMINVGVCMIQLFIGSYRLDNVEKHKKHKNEKYLKITFRSDSNDYFYLVRVLDETEPIKQIVNEMDEDVTGEILPYISYDEGITTPADFGYKRLNVRTVFEQEIVFEENELISLTYVSE